MQSGLDTNLSLNDHFPSEWVDSVLWPVLCDSHQLLHHLCHNVLSNQIWSNDIYLITIGILIHEHLGLDTKITFLLQLEQELRHIYRSKVWHWRSSWIFMFLWSHRYYHVPHLILGIWCSTIPHLPGCFVPGPSFRISDSTWCRRTSLCYI